MLDSTQPRVAVTALAFVLLMGCGAQTAPANSRAEAPATAPAAPAASGVCKSVPDAQDGSFRYVESESLGFRINVIATAKVDCSEDRAVVTYEEGLTRMLMRVREPCEQAAQCLLDSAGGTVHGLAEKRGLPLAETLPTQLLGDDRRLAHCVALPFTIDGTAAVTLVCVTGALVAGGNLVGHSVWYTLEQSAFEADQDGAWSPVLTLSAEWSPLDATQGKLITGDAPPAP